MATADTASAPAVALFTYTYKLVADVLPKSLKKAQVVFPFAKVDLQRVKEEVQRSDITLSLADVSTDTVECIFTFRGQLSDDEVMILDGVVESHSGEPLITPRTDVRIKPFVAGSRDPQIVGYRMECELNTDTNLDIKFPEDREIQSANVEVANVTDGDNFDMLAVHPDPRIGVLLQFGKSIYMSPDGHRQYNSEDAKTLPAGLIIRFVYHSTAKDGPKPILYIDLKTWK